MENSRRERKRRKWSGKRQLGIGLTVLVTVLMFSFIYLVEFAAQPAVNERAEAKQIARQYTGIKRIDQVDIYRGKDVVYSVFGTDAKQAKKLVLIPKNGDKIRIFDAKNGISAKEAGTVARKNGAKGADRVLAGLYEDQPIWEVKAGTAYYLIDFQTGKFVKKEGL